MFQSNELAQLEVSRLLGTPNKPTNNKKKNPQKKPVHENCIFLIVVSFIYNFIENDIFVPKLCSGWGEGSDVAFEDKVFYYHISSLILRGKEDMN